MKRTPGDQGTLFGATTATRPGRRRPPPKQTGVSISAEAIVAATAGRIEGERIVAAAVRAALLALAGGATPEPFRFILGRATRAARPVRPAVPPVPD